MALIETLVDDFSFADFAKFSPTGAAAVVNGRLVLPVNSSYADSFFSVAQYDLTGSAVFAEMVQPPNLGTGTTEAYLRVKVDASNLMDLLYSGGNLVFQESVAGVPNSTSVPFDPIA